MEVFEVKESYLRLMINIYVEKGVNLVMVLNFIVDGVIFIMDGKLLNVRYFVVELGSFVKFGIIL